MKEGYLQEKLREFDYKLKQQMNLLQQMEKELDLLFTSKKELKSLIKKLKDLETFKDTLYRDLKKANADELQTTIKKTQKLVTKTMTDELKKNLGDLTKQIEKTTEQLETVEIMLDQVQKNTKQSIYTKHLCDLLIEELLKERVLSNERAEILSKRASIRTSDDIKEKK
jgi:hypothetical protein